MLDRRGSIGREKVVPFFFTHTHGRITILMNEMKNYAIIFTDRQCTRHGWKYPNHLTTPHGV